jgi:hypothetical protein
MQQSIFRRTFLANTGKNVLSLFGLQQWMIASTTDTIGRTITGSYQGAVTFPDGSKVAVLLVFHADGTLSETNVKTNNPGLGTWRHTGSDAQGLVTFSYVMREFLVESGTFTGTVHVFQQATLSLSGETFSASGEGILLDPEGKELLRNHTSTHATRF